MKQVNPEVGRRAVEEWNESVPVGTEVIVTRDDASTLKTNTRSAAWMMVGHTAVVMVNGIAGGFLLDRVQPIRADAPGQDGSAGGTPAAR